MEAIVPFAQYMQTQVDLAVGEKDHRLRDLEKIAQIANDSLKVFESAESINNQRNQRSIFYGYSVHHEWQ